jgi:Domain of unknown function (DUF4291)
MTIPEREVRAVYTPTHIRVYQAYSDAIAESAISRQTFVSPPFSMTRMTWIKPSFLWMMYRAGWGRKDACQSRILAIDISHEGFAWALAHACPSHPEPGQSEADWRAAMAATPVRVQWDPERDLHHIALPHRAIQIGLSGEAVKRYTQDWIGAITDVTALAHAIHARVLAGDLDGARAMLPVERAYAWGPTHD